MFQFHLSAINYLVFLSILDLLLLNNFLKNENQVFFCEIFFLDSQLNSLRQNFFNSKYIVQNFSTNGGQSHLKL